MKIELDAWSEAEMDFYSALAVMYNLSETLHAEGNQQGHDVAYASVRLIESALAWVQGGIIRGEEDSSDGDSGSDV